MNDTLSYRIGPTIATSPTAGAADEQARPWFAISGPAQLHSSEMAARIEFLERKLAAFEATPVVG